MAQGLDVMRFLGLAAEYYYFYYVCTTFLLGFYYVLTRVYYLFLLGFLLSRFRWDPDGWPRAEHKTPGNIRFSEPRKIY